MIAPVHIKCDKPWYGVRNSRTVADASTSCHRPPLAKQKSRKACSRRRVARRKLVPSRHPRLAISHIRILPRPQNHRCCYEALG